MEDWYGGLTNRRAGSSTDRSVERMRLSQGRFSAGLVIIHELPRRCLLGNPYPASCIKTRAPEVQSGLGPRPCVEPDHNM
jgi:hypothetical protein